MSHAAKVTTATPMYEYAGNLVRKAGDGGLRGVGVFHELDNLGEARVGAHACGTEGERAGTVDGGRTHRVARPLLDGDGLAGKRALVHRAHALEHDAVHRQGLAGAHADRVTHG